MFSEKIKEIADKIKACSPNFWECGYHNVFIDSQNIVYDLESERAISIETVLGNYFIILPITTVEVTPEKYSDAFKKYSLNRKFRIYFIFEAQRAKIGNIIKCLLFCLSPIKCLKITAINDNSFNNVVDFISGYTDETDIKDLLAKLANSGFNIISFDLEVTGMAHPNLDNNCNCQIC